VFSFLLPTLGDRGTIPGMYTVSGTRMYTVGELFSLLVAVAVIGTLIVVALLLF